MLLAKGEYVQFLDADDLLFTPKIAHQVSLILKEKIMPDFVAGNEYWRKIDGAEVVLNQFTYDPWFDLIHGALGYTCSNLWKTESLRKINGWNEKLKSSQEIDLIFRLLKDNAIILYDSEPLTVNRQRRLGSISTQNRKENLNRFLQIRIDVKNYLSRGNMLNPYLYNAINKMLLVAIRELFIYDRDMASDLFLKNISLRFIWSKGSQMTITHKVLLSFLGFKLSESLIINLKKWR